jgi:ferredoxin
MKRITIDEDLCQGAKECAAIAAEAVEFNDEGIAHATGAVLADDIAGRMAAACPGMAISVIDEQADPADDTSEE